MFRRLEHVALLSALLAALAAGRASAVDFELGGGVTGSLRTQVALGAGWRAEGRKVPLVGKLNLPGQEQFCEDKDPDGPLGPEVAPGINCQTVAGNAAFLALPGYPSVNFDNGNLNYDRGDVIAAAVKVAPRLQLTWNEFGLDVSGLWFYDHANVGFTDYHQNNREDNNGFQPREEPRRQDVEDQVGTRFELLDAYVSGTVALPGERALSVKLGNQILSIGSSTLLVFNSLNSVNPPNANIRFLPGSDVREVFKRLPLLSLGSSVTEQLSVETFYALGWEPVETPPIGGFFSTNDVVGAGGGYVMALFGKYREDPMNLIGVEERTQGNANQLSDAGRTLYVNPEREPRDGGEYGLSVNYFAEGLNNTTFTLAYLNLHSRLPLVSFVASQEGCAHDSTNAADATVACQGFRTAVNAGLEVAPIDTVRVFAEYPEDIRAFGGSFSTNLGDVAWTGELVYRPNQPLQVDVTDVGFAALQPIFPADTIPIGPVNIPGRRVAAPDYVETLYRGNANVQPGQDIHGYERFQTLNWNSSLLALLGASDNPFGADQLTALLEVGAFQVLDLPPLEQLQLGTPGVFFHRSAGVDGTGSTTTNQDRLNPSFQQDGYATEFAWGYRILSGLNYEDVFWGVKLLPQVTFFHDVDGRAALPAAEFVEGRKQASLGLGFSYESTWSGAVRHNWFFGGGTANALADRDYLQLNLSYDF